MQGRPVYLDNSSYRGAGGDFWGIIFLSLSLWERVRNYQNTVSKNRQTQINQPILCSSVYICVKGVRNVLCFQYPWMGLVGWCDGAG